MNFIMYRVMNADFPVTCRGVNVHTHVKYVIRFSGIRVIW
jgi:hypothetical protein